MRRWIGVGVLLVALAGCSLPAGIDGTVTDDWSALPEPKLWSPKAGECHRYGSTDVAPLGGYSPVSCAESHVAETVHLGTFVGDHAARDTVPPSGSPERCAAFGECVAKTVEFLGDDFRTGRAWLRVALPTGSAWSGGARWFRCDLSEYTAEDDWDVQVTRTSSLRDSLKGVRPLGFGCYAVTKIANKIDKMDPVACDKPHNAEFAGIGIARDVPLPTTDQQRRDVLESQCFAPVAAFAGLRNDGQLSSRVGFIWQGMGANEWNRGNRGVRCWLRLEKNVTKSMKGAGPSAFPTR